MSSAPTPTPASSSRTPATRGPPNTADTAENDPAELRMRISGSPTRIAFVTMMPVMPPSAMSGASGPSTAPKPRVPRAAMATPKNASTGSGAALMPSSGSWPPSPGSSRRASRTTTPPTAGRNRISHHGGSDRCMLCGTVSQSQCCNTWTSQRNPKATKAAGMPISAAMPITRRYWSGRRAGGAGAAAVPAAAGPDGFAMRQTVTQEASATGLTSPTSAWARQGGGGGGGRRYGRRPREPKPGPKPEPTPRPGRGPASPRWTDRWTRLPGHIRRVVLDTRGYA